LSAGTEADAAPIAMRRFERVDVPAVQRFIGTLPVHDLLFLGRDIRQPKVVEAWHQAIEAGWIESVLAIAGEEVVASTAAIRDPLSWSPHVCELRLLVSPSVRNRGIGRLMLERAVDAAIAGGATKLMARMTPDQAGAITLFEESGFRGEALLRDHVRDENGVLFDLAILSLDPARDAARRAAYGDLID
jgi:L-amino acid N-acyltransferase YncA